MKQVQSYISVMLNGKFSVYQMRIFLKIVQRAQALMKANGGRYSDYINKAFCMDGYNVNFAVPVQEIVGGKCHNYSPLKEAILTMESGWIVQHYDWDKRVWRATPVIYNAEIEEQSGILRFTCANWLVSYITDFRRYGYRSYDYDVAMSLRNPNTAKLYLLTCSQDKSLQYSLDTMKRWLGVENIYKRPADFARRCLEPAKKELEKLGVNGFDYEFTHERKDKKTSPITGVVLKPVKRGKAEEVKNAAETNAEVWTSIDKTLVNYLVTNVGFTIKELSKVKDDLIAFTALDDWRWKITDIITRARQKRKNHGWIIQAVRGEIKKSTH